MSSAPPPFAGTSPYPAPGSEPAPRVRRGVLATWLQRVGAHLVDVLVALAPWLVAGPFAYLTAERGVDVFGEPSIMTTTAGDWAVLAALAVQVALWIANRWVLQGRTGRSVGKRVLGLRLADQRTGVVPGTGRTIGREIAHVLDWPGPLGFLWPLWDRLTQTFADKVSSTVVVRER
ncbi:RDD family protein [Actinotalea sp. Marseille-Q4924]|uniref:RDD family protein n=1 Tax=Actinotalea sp. Marseille-Q4924 TaxID=2866571 RepID=UPI001CE3E18C|nr:RDD family protein [Actinotalea sp. Marseille-Q4924]